ncbi:MAG: helix-hairpin-helix domain-containing protein [Propionibacteriaceae bacterium]
MSRIHVTRSPIRSRRLDVETAELARRRLNVVLRPRPALPTWSDQDDDDLRPDDDLGIEGGVGVGIGGGIGRGGASGSDPGLDGEPRDAFEPDVLSSRARASGGLVDRARTFTRGHLGVVLALAVVALLVAAAGVARARPLAVAERDVPPVALSAGPSTSATAMSGSTPGPTSTTSSSAPVGLVVHVLGAVRQTGVVRLPAGARVGDAIKAAGGLAQHADPGDLNLAQPLLDGQQVVVVTRAAGQRDPPAHSEVRDPGVGPTRGGGARASGAPTGSAGSSPDKVNLNTATAEQLDGLSGVGPVTAQRILDWRAEHGRFSRIEELQEVDGIGPKTFAELAPQVTV